MRSTIKTLVPIACATLALCLAAPSRGAAQERQLTVEPPSLPALPQLTGREARWVGHLERVARRTLGCVTFEGDRGGEEYEDPRCWDWYDRLHEANAGGVHASGRVLLASLETADDLGESHERLISLLGHSERRIAAPYLLHLLARAQGDGPQDTRLASEVLANLDTLAQADVAPIAPWTNRYDVLRDPEARARALDGWLRWHEAAKDERYRDWRRAGLAQAEANLHAVDPVTRFAAIERLRASHRRHHAIVESLRELIAQPELSPTARRYVTRYAGLHGLMTRGEVRELLRSV